MGHLTLRGARCIVPYLPRPAAVDLVAASMVGMVTTSMRPQASFLRLYLSLVSEQATAMAAVSATTPSARSVTTRAEVSAKTLVAGSAGVLVTSSAKGVCTGATGGTYRSVSGRTCGEVDDCIDWDGSGARTASRVRSSGEGRTTLSVERGFCGDGVSGWEGGDVITGSGGVPP